MVMRTEGGEKLDLPDCNIWYFPGFLSPEEATKYFQQLKEETDWQQDDIKIFGKTFPQPRLTALYGNNQKPYRYSNIIMHPLKFTPLLEDLKAEIDKISGISFSTCLLNLYRDGQDSNGWHADDEKELGTNPVIASLSLGEERVFHLKHRRNKEFKHRILLEHGSLLLMKGSTQHNWLHQIPKTRRQIGERINLTFRLIQ